MEIVTRQPRQARQVFPYSSLYRKLSGNKVKTCLVCLVNPSKSSFNKVKSSFNKEKTYFLQKSNDFLTLKNPKKA